MIIRPPCFEDYFKIFVIKTSVVLLPTNIGDELDLLMPLNIFAKMGK